MKKILVVVGTRPEVIKLAPVIIEFARRGRRDLLYVVNTNQHKDYVYEDLAQFAIQADYNFPLERNSDNLTELNGKLLLCFQQLKSAFSSFENSIIAIMAQGDTASAFCAAQFAFHERIPLLHVEAGLRTGDFSEPFPEEFYRTAISRIASVHFAPTHLAQENLAGEGITKNVLVTGNTALDNLKELFTDGQKSFACKPSVVITIHRRENLFCNFSGIVSDIMNLCRLNSSRNFQWIDNAGHKIRPLVSSVPPNLHIIEPVPFGEMLEIYQRCELIITDSGGLQEEAAFAGIPVVVARGKTERMEGMNAGISMRMDELTGDLQTVIASMKGKLTEANRKLYGDGNASQRIVDFISERVLTSAHTF